jgi:hypothetical protein
MLVNLESKVAKDVCGYFTTAQHMIQSDQQETKSRVLPHLLFYRNVFVTSISRFYLLAAHSFCWLPTSQKSIINCLYKFFVIHE